MVSNKATMKNYVTIDLNDVWAACPSDGLIPNGGRAEPVIFVPYVCERYGRSFSESLDDCFGLGCGSVICDEYLIRQRSLSENTFEY